MKNDGSGFSFWFDIWEQVEFKKYIEWFPVEILFNFTLGLKTIVKVGCVLLLPYLCKYVYQWIDKISTWREYDNV